MLFLVPLYCTSNFELNKYNCTHAMRINSKLMMYCNTTKNHQTLIKYDMLCNVSFIPFGVMNITCSFTNGTKCMIYGTCYLYKNTNGIIGNCNTYHNNLTCANTNTYFFNMCIPYAPIQLEFIIPIILSAFFFIIFVFILITKVGAGRVNNNMRNYQHQYQSYNII